MTGRRVVVLDHTGQLGGAEIALQRLLTALGDEWDVSVLLFSDGPFRDALQGAGLDVEVLAMPERTSGQSRRSLTDPRVLLRSGTDSLAFAEGLANRLLDLDADLVVANSLKAAVLAELSSWRTHLPWAWHLHDRLAPDYLPAPVVLALRRLARRAAHVVANSLDVARLTGLPPSRVTVAYPGLPDDAFADHHLTPVPPVFGLLGRISSTKGQREFIQAAAVVGHEHPDVRFRIVGEALFSDQPYEAEVRQLAAQLAIADRIEWTGWAQDPRVAIDGFTALVHASPVAEPFGQVIVEAMARHVPIIATASGGVRDILGAPPGAVIKRGTPLQSPRGLLVPPLDVSALAKAMADILESLEVPEELRALQKRTQHANECARNLYSIPTTSRLVASAWQESTRGRANRHSHRRRET